MYLLLVHWVGVSPLGQPLSPGAGPWWGWGWCHYGHCLFAVRKRLTRLHQLWTSLSSALLSLKPQRVISHVPGSVAGTKQAHLP